MFVDQARGLAVSFRRYARKRHVASRHLPADIIERALGFRSEAPMRLKQGG